MNIYIYSDESGVFDATHYPFFVYGGILIVGKEEKDNWTRLYSAAEKIVRDQTKIPGELKACKLDNHYKYKLYKSLHRVYKFGVVINSRKLNQQIFKNKKHKQRYLDYAFKIVLKNLFKKLINEKVLNKNDIDHIYVNPDEHGTATDGRYELSEGLYNEFKNGTFNMNYNLYFEPILPDMKGEVYVQFCDSASNRLVRAADIVVNHIYHLVLSGLLKETKEDKLFIMNLP